MKSKLITSHCNYCNNDQIDSLNKHQVFNCRTNKTGVVRDHIISKITGFKLLVFPQILRHPCNCQIITHSENSSKRSKMIIKLEDLFEKIIYYTGNWKEQQQCLLLITRYKNGDRWSRKEVHYVC